MNKNELYNDSEYKLVKLTNEDTVQIFGSSSEQKFINVAALYSVSTYEHAVETCNIIKHLNPKAEYVMDATVCVGGNTGPMVSAFKRVLATELDPKNFVLAKSNLLGSNNLELIQGSCIDVLYNRDQDIDAIFIDPPWNLEHSGTIDHSTIGIPGVSLRDMVHFLLNYTDYVVLKTHRRDDVRYYEKYLEDTKYEVLCIEISNYKLMLIAPRGDPGLDFSRYTLPDLHSFNYKRVLDQAGLLNLQ
jgi:predicted RNA methylase